MSIFQLKEWWSSGSLDGYGSSQIEEFDVGSLCVGNIDNSTPVADKIITASQTGVVRIYNPNSGPGFKATDLLHQEVLKQPVLQILCGRFLSEVGKTSTGYIGLAVLHSKKLVVYELLANKGSGALAVAASSSNEGKGSDSAFYYSLAKVYEHDLEADGTKFAAYNMISGSFGGAEGREMLMVQSMDGKIAIYEQSAHALTRQLAGCLLPGCLAYLPSIDAFVTSNYANQVECYLYHVLASSDTDIGSSSKESSTSGRRVAIVEWSLQLGDTCRQIVPGLFTRMTLSSSQNRPGLGRRQAGEVLILCDKCLYLLKDSGRMMQQKRLEKQPACLSAYDVIGSEMSNFIIVYADGMVQVFSDFNVVWAAKLTGIRTSAVPVQACVGPFGALSGLVTIIDDGGATSVSYLGTKPSVTTAHASSQHARDLDYGAIDTEHRQLLKVIKDRQAGVGKASSGAQESVIVLKAQVSKIYDKEVVPCSQLPPAHVPSSAISSSSNGALKVSVRVYVSLSGEGAATTVTIAPQVPSWLHAHPSSAVLDVVSGGTRGDKTPLVVKFTFFALKSNLPASLRTTFVATYSSTSGDAKVVSLDLLLPLHLACRLRPPVKTAQFKLTLETAAGPLPLTDIFEDTIYACADAGVDMTAALGPSAAAAMAFQMWSPDTLSGAIAVVSILVSKQGGRYRLQSDSLPALYVVAQELRRRLVSRFQDGPDPKPVTCVDELPINSYFLYINEHFNRRKLLEDLYAQLNDRAHMFRTVQKRLLVRFKDKNPSLMEGLSELMETTYSRILQLSDEIEENQQIVARLMNDISCISKLLCLMLHLCHESVSEEDRALLERYLCVDMCEGHENGWEESVDASLVYLLKTSLAKTQKESVALPASLLETMAPDTDELKKHMMIVFDRLGRGHRLMGATLDLGHK